MSSELSQRYEGILVRMEAACARARRLVDDVKLVAVSKTFGPDRVNEAVCGEEIKILKQTC